MKPGKVLEFIKVFFMSGKVLEEKLYIILIYSFTQFDLNIMFILLIKLLSH